jgi:hypothetical protein
MKNGIILHNLDTFFQGKHEYIDLKLSHIDKKTTKSIFLHHFCI